MIELIRDVVGFGFLILGLFLALLATLSILFYTLITGKYAP